MQNEDMLQRQSTLFCRATFPLYQLSERQLVHAIHANQSSNANCVDELVQFGMKDSCSCMGVQQHT